MIGTARSRASVVAAVMLSAGAVLSLSLGSQEARTLERPLAEFPDSLPGLSQAWADTLTHEEIRVLGADDYLYRTYRAGDAGSVSLFVAWYGRQLAGSSIHSPRNCLPGAGWEPVRHDRIDLSGAEGAAQVNRYIVEHTTGQRALVYYWYQGRGRIAANEYSVKWDLLRDAVIRRRTDEALVRVIVPLEPGESAPAEDPVALLAGVRAALAGHLPS